MASLKDLRVRIASVKATQKITKAMQMVAAAKLRRAQDSAQNARPYAQRMAAVIANEFTEAVGDMHLAALAYVALVLFMLTVLVNAAARLLIWRVSGRAPAGGKGA